VSCQLEAGDVLMQCTDGLLEASDPHRTEFGEMRAAGSLLAHAEAGFADVVDRIAMDGRRFAAGTFQDDVTVLALQCAPPEAAPPEPGDPV
jgi:serine phosphatase RsbU (regulator of sigma subunit)